MATPEILGVDMVEALKVDQASISAAEFVYLNLEKKSSLAERKDYPLFRAFLESAEGSIEEWSYARKAAICYLIRTAQQLQQTRPERREYVSNHFTESSIDIYDEPDPGLSAGLISLQLQELEQHAGNPNVDQDRLARVTDNWKRQTSREELHNFTAAFEPAKTALAGVLEGKFSNAFAVLEASAANKQAMKPVEIAAAISTAKDALAKTEPAWDDWQVKLVEGSDIAVSEPDREIRVGRDRPDLPVGELKPKFTHEVLVHGLRAVDGAKTGNRLMELGLPDNLDAEEGLATFMAYAAGGIVPARMFDRYIDTAQALGTLGAPALSRADLQKNYLDRLIINHQIENTPFDMAALEYEAWQYVYRIYRGSLGNEIIAVNTKDIAYANGFLKMGRYITDRLTEGVDASVLFDYLMSGKFDPTDPRHAAYAAQYIAS